MGCKHSHFITETKAEHFVNPQSPDIITGYWLELTVCCGLCGLPFEFMPTNDADDADTKLEVRIRPSSDPVHQAKGIINTPANDPIQARDSINIQHVNNFIEEHIQDHGAISDGFHTFNEVYEMRNVLWISLCRNLFRTAADFDVIRTRKDHDQFETPGWFLLCVNRLPSGEQASFHLPNTYWDDCAFAFTRNHNAHYDGHTSQQVAERIKRWCMIPQTPPTPQ